MCLVGGVALATLALAPGGPHMFKTDGAAISLDDASNGPPQRCCWSGCGQCETDPKAWCNAKGNCEQACNGQMRACVEDVSQSSAESDESPEHEGEQEKRDDTTKEGESAKAGESAEEGDDEDKKGGRAKGDDAPRRGAAQERQASQAEGKCCWGESCESIETAYCSEKSNCKGTCNGNWIIEKQRKGADIAEDGNKAKESGEALDGSDKEPSGKDASPEGGGIAVRSEAPQQGSAEPQAAPQEDQASTANEEEQPTMQSETAPHGSEDGSKASSEEQQNAGEDQSEPAEHGKGASNTGGPQGKCCWGQGCETSKSAYCSQEAACKQSCRGRWVTGAEAAEEAKEAGAGEDSVGEPVDDGQEQDKARHANAAPAGEDTPDRKVTGTRGRCCWGDSCDPNPATYCSQEKHCRASCNGKWVINDDSEHEDSEETKDADDVRKGATEGPDSTESGKEGQRAESGEADGSEGGSE